MMATKATESCVFSRFSRVFFSPTSQPLRGPQALSIIEAPTRRHFEEADEACLTVVVSSPKHARESIAKLKTIKQNNFVTSFAITSQVLWGMLKNSIKSETLTILTG